MLRNIRFCSVVITILLAICVQADGEMDKADRLFEARFDDVKNVAAAKELYAKIIESKSQQSLLRNEALDKYGRLALLEGELLRAQLGIDKTRAKNIFEDCIQKTSYLSPENSGSSTPQYTFWRAVCLGLWAQNSGVLAITNWSRIKEMRALVTTGLDKFKTFDNYGFNRLQAGLFLHGKGVLVPGFPFKPQSAWQLIMEAITYGSTEVYSNYLLKAEIEVALKQKAQAKRTLEQAIDRLEQKMQADNLARDAQAEAKIYLEKMKSMLKTL